MESRSHIQCFIHSSVGVISVCLERKSSLRRYRIYASCRFLHSCLQMRSIMSIAERRQLLIWLKRTTPLATPPQQALEPQPTRQRGGEAPARCCFQTTLTFMWVDVRFRHLKINSCCLKNVKCAVFAYSQYSDRKFRLVAIKLLLIYCSLEVINRKPAF